MTVKQLKEALSAYPDDMPVFYDTYDCVSNTLMSADNVESQSIKATDNGEILKILVISE